MVLFFIPVGLFAGLYDKNNIGLRRPGNGLPPKMFEKLLGKKANKNYEIGDKIQL